VSIETGSVALDENLPKFQQELRDAGIDKIIEEKQRQFDEWKAVNR
jgi:putative aldouronate transport system substrate-binding protein